MKLSIKFTLLAVLVLSAKIYGQVKQRPTVLKGVLVNFGGAATLEDFSDLQHIVPDAKNPVITLKDSTFELSFEQAEPTYYRLGRNKLYLMPGDELEMRVDKNTALAATFKGKRAKENLYLNETAFPKGGSYLQSGTLMKSTPDSTMAMILDAARKRTAQLNTIKPFVVPAFYKLEQSRIRAEIISSIEAVEPYMAFVFANKTKEFRDAFATKFAAISKPLKDSLTKNFMDPTLLQLEVYRDIYKSLPVKAETDAAKKQKMTDWMKAVRLATSKIKNEGNKVVLSNYADSILLIKTSRYQKALKTLLADKMKFGNGDEAIDFEVRQTDGTVTKLSSLKGKLIYIDIWATWCGPCMAAMPDFEKLKEEYKGRSDVALVSLSVDDSDEIWLKNVKKRNPGGIQWRVDRATLADYNVLGIPRYILIGKDFKVLQMAAPEAADPVLKRLLDQSK